MNGVKQPHVGAVSPGIHFIGPAPEGDVKLFLKHYFATDMYCQRFFLKHIATTTNKTPQRVGWSIDQIESDGSRLYPAPSWDENPDELRGPIEPDPRPSTHAISARGRGRMCSRARGSQLTALSSSSSRGTWEHPPGPDGGGTPLPGSAEKQKGGSLRAATSSHDRPTDNDGPSHRDVATRPPPSPVTSE